MISTDLKAPETEPVRHKRAWLRVLGMGLLLYIVGVAILVLTGNTTLFPTVVIIGNFMVPAAFVAFFYERRHLSSLSLQATALSFFWGGVLGGFAASLLEPLFVNQSVPISAFVIAGIEEAAKILGVLVIARHHRHTSEIDGIIAGAAAGMGFAALESTGYAFNAFLASQGSLSTAVGVTLLRGLFAPLGHGVWTAILAGVLFRESRPGRFRLSLPVLGAYVTVVILHGLWDFVPMLLSGLPVPGLDVFIAQVVVGIAGLVILWLRWREGRRRQDAEMEADSGGSMITEGSAGGY
jgi:RsiW-degrading membrane proteinase PrsW (M82 family)